jgi:hypothetical protein
MKYYSIYIYGYGTMSIYGKLTKEQYDFWHDKDEVDISNHVNDYEGNLISYEDEDDPRFIGSLWELGDIEQMSGADLYSSDITIDEVKDEEYNSPSIKSIVDGSIEEFIKSNKNKITRKRINLAASADEDGHNRIIYCLREERGSFYESVIKIPDDGELDLSKIEFHVKHGRREANIDTLTYDGIELFNEGSGGDEKDFSVEIMDLLTQKLIPITKSSSIIKVESVEYISAVEFHLLGEIEELDEELGEKTIVKSINNRVNQFVEAFKNSVKDAVKNNGLDITISKAYYFNDGNVKEITDGNEAVTLHDITEDYDVDGIGIIFVFDQECFGGDVMSCYRDTSLTFDIDFYCFYNSFEDWYSQQLEGGETVSGEREIKENNDNNKILNFCRSTYS